MSNVVFVISALILLQIQSYAQFDESDAAYMKNFLELNTTLNAILKDYKGVVSHAFEEKEPYYTNDECSEAFDNLDRRLAILEQAWKKLHLRPDIFTILANLFEEYVTNLRVLMNSDSIWCQFRKTNIEERFFELGELALDGVESYQKKYNLELVRLKSEYENYIKGN